MTRTTPDNKRTRFTIRLADGTKPGETVETWRHYPAGYRMHNGTALTEPQAATYNRMTDDIHRFARQFGFVDEWRLNERHRHFVLCAEVNREATA